ncbi:MAG: lamin tail domain-containing protein [Candidatus Zixiibacteriota bacterium]
MRHVATVIICTSLLAASSTADVVINEVLSNEPGGAQSLEWVELFNDSPDSKNLTFYQLRAYSATDSSTHLLSGMLAPQAYHILCRDTVRFEQHWGDSSGVWGDVPFEQAFSIGKVSFQLSNSSGRVTLSDPVGPVSQLRWTQSGSDGYSWERIHPLIDSSAPSIDPSGSTPGRMNSVTPLPIDLALESISASAVENGAELVFRITNIGLTSINSSVLELYEFDSLEPDSQGVLITGESVGPVDSGLTVLLVGQYSLSGYYQRLVANLFVLNDDRPNNNRRIFVAPGEDYPPVILSELLANPDPAFGSEWVELKNVSDMTIDLAGWFLGDSVGFAEIAVAELSIDPYQYLVLAEDTVGFVAAYPLFSGDLHQPAAWRGLNNSSDSVRLVDAFNIQADRFYYIDVHDNNHTWARSESMDNLGRWGRSEDAGGTPGEPNRVRFAPDGSRTLSISIEPRIISPDGDGRDDSTVIKLEASPAESFSLRLYDSKGRKVRTFEDKVIDLKEQYVWCGESDSGEKLPIGIYILYFEAAGVESAKKTVVVAR